MTEESVIQLAKAAMDFQAGRGPGRRTARRAAANRPKFPITIQRRLSTSPENRVETPAHRKCRASSTGRICRTADAALKRAMRANSWRAWSNTRLNDDTDAIAALPQAKRSAVV